MKFYLNPTVPLLLASAVSNVKAEKMLKGGKTAIPTPNPTPAPTHGKGIRPTPAPKPSPAQIPSPNPTPAPTFPIVGRNIAAGLYSTCATDSNNDLFCSGSEGKTRSNVPLYKASDVGKVDIGDYHGCLFYFQYPNKLFCWGNNEYGQVGVGRNEVFVSEPNLVPELEDLGVKDFALGAYHSCAIAGEKDELYCWGYNWFGQVGFEGEESVFVPTPVEGLDGVKGVSLGGYHSCAIAGEKDELYCWGRNVYGQVGIEGEESVFVPTPVEGLDGVKGVSLGRYHSCAIAGEKDALYCWGYNGVGQLGFEGEESVFVPTPVEGLDGVKGVSLGGFHSCAIAGEKDELYCWGYNMFGQVVFEGEKSVFVPTPVEGLDGVKGVSLGGFHSCAIAGEKDEFYCWGRNDEGQLGVGDNALAKPYYNR